MGQVAEKENYVEEKKSNVVSFSAFVEVKEDELSTEVNGHLMDMVLLVCNSDENFKNRLLDGIEKL